MSYRARFFLALVVIIVVSWFDYQFLSYHPDTFPLSESLRRVLHLSILAVVMLAGGFAWAVGPHAWIRTIWWFSYLFAIAFLFVVGIVAHYAPIFSYPVLFAFYEFRIFFCSPLPMFILLILSTLGKTQK